MGMDCMANALALLFTSSGSLFFFIFNGNSATILTMCTYEFPTILLNDTAKHHWLYFSFAVGNRIFGLIENALVLLLVFDYPLRTETVAPLFVYFNHLMLETSAIQSSHPIQDWEVESPNSYAHMTLVHAVRVCPCGVPALFPAGIGGYGLASL